MSAQVMQFPDPPIGGVQVTPAPYVRIPLAAIMFGLTDKAIRRKIEEGKWIDGREYKRSPDGEIFISIRGVTRWIEGGAAA